MSEFERKWRELTDALERQANADGESFDTVWKPIHEVYLDAQAGGFTKDEALRLIAYGMFQRTIPDEEDE